MRPNGEFAEAGCKLKVGQNMELLASNTKREYKISIGIPSGYNDHPKDPVVLDNQSLYAQLNSLRSRWASALGGRIVTISGLPLIPW